MSSSKLFQVTTAILVDGTQWGSITQTCEAGSHREAINFMRRYYHKAGVVDHSGKRIAAHRLAIVRPQQARRLYSTTNDPIAAAADVWSLEKDSILFLDLPPAREIAKRILRSRKLRQMAAIAQ